MLTEVHPSLYVTDMQTVQTSSLSADRVVTVCQDSVADNISCAYDHFNLSDGPTDHPDARGEFGYGTFSDAADAVVSAIESGESVVVHCHMGRSRSPSVAIAAIAVIEDIRYNEAYNRVSDERYIQPHRELVDMVQEYIEQHRPS